jgi:hypothetical protein
MRYLLLIAGLALVACSTPTTPTLEPSSYNPHRIAVPDETPNAVLTDHVCQPTMFGGCWICMVNKTRKPRTPADTTGTGWSDYNPFPMFGQPYNWD